MRPAFRIAVSRGPGPVRVQAFLAARARPSCQRASPAVRRLVLHCGKNGIVSFPNRPRQRMKTSYPKQDIKVLLLEGVSQTALESLRAAGYSNIEFHEKALPPDEL